MWLSDLLWFLPWQSGSLTDLYKTNRNYWGMTVRHVQKKRTSRQFAISLTPLGSSWMRTPSPSGTMIPTSTVSRISQPTHNLLLASASWCEMSLTFAPTIGSPVVKRFLFLFPTFGTFYIFHIHSVQKRFFLLPITYKLQLESVVSIYVYTGNLYLYLISLVFSTSFGIV